MLFSIFHYSIFILLMIQPAFTAQRSITRLIPIEACISFLYLLFILLFHSFIIPFFISLRIQPALTEQRTITCLTVVEGIHLHFDFLFFSVFFFIKDSICLHSTENHHASNPNRSIYFIFIPIFYFIFPFFYYSIFIWLRIQSAFTVQRTKRHIITIEVMIAAGQPPQFPMRQCVCVLCRENVCRLRHVKLANQPALDTKRDFIGGGRHQCGQLTRIHHRWRDSNKVLERVAMRNLRHLSEMVDSR